MREKIKLSNEKIGAVTGHVVIDYIDSLTGRIKERIDDCNHVFIDQFDSNQWYNFLNYSSNPTLFITNDNTPPDNNFQYLRGNLIGWGTATQDASGNYRGRYNADESYRAQLMDNLGGMSWKWVYDFSAAQIPEPIGSIGLSGQYLSYYSQNSPPFPNRRLVYTVEAAYYAFNGEVGYNVNNAGIVTIYNPLTGEKKTKDVSAITGTSNTLCIGFNGENGKFYIFAYHSTAANRKMYEFSDDTFEDLLMTYSTSNIASYPSTSKVFTVSENYFYYWTGGWARADFVNNVNTVMCAGQTACPLNTAVMNGNTASITTIDGYAYASHDFYSTTASYTTIWDLKNNKLVAYLCANNKGSSTSYNQHSALNPYSDNKLLLWSRYENLLFYQRNAYTCYALPNDAPVRPADSGVKISYQLDILY